MRQDQMFRGGKAWIGRTLLACSVGCGLFGCSRAESSASAPSPMRMIVVGQALIDYDIRQYRPDSFREMTEALRGEMSRLRISRCRFAGQTMCRRRRAG